MKIKEIELSTRIENLTLEIKHLVESYNLPKDAIIQDFYDLIKSEFIKMENQ